jgi:L-ascorbate metabolism protein UlaG (beta-lactamase superfamily)
MVARFAEMIKGEERL